MARTLICENDLPKSLWVQVVNIENYVLKGGLSGPFSKIHHMKFSNSRN